MKIKIKSFEELTKEELYRILQLRAEVFVVEQACAYLDLDGLDQKALHVIGYGSNDICAYTRIFRAGDYFEEASIGRVVVSPQERGKAYGKEIMQASLSYISNTLNSRYTVISAQLYLRKFYEEMGFKTEGEEYLEDDIPHIRMRRTDPAHTPADTSQEDTA
ncbi:ElaA protein [Muriicola jejuensis]|uniref:GNAT family N-acetyltransferase n=1 Tax=Muriicola jejuensis TaxID=504488 RepID=A0A6P0UIC8_9FLAO|nr:GNAT family N-acetyltransferase [Muriicola jejuensis]NER09946.1 GNAT family N-acetyltransferase [Muriicola jejuensis]SMP04506.1 ElaA protein [Muriicola jejuensis]